MRTVPPDPLDGTDQPPNHKTRSGRNPTQNIPQLSPTITERKEIAAADGAEIHAAAAGNLGRSSAMSRPAALYLALLVEDVRAAVLEGRRSGHGDGAACAVGRDGRRGGREMVGERDTVTAGRETASARKTEAELPLCAGACSRGMERSCSPHIARGWRPPSAGPSSC